ncbi:unnamed protein product [Acanthocheilonema viteae]|uniref:Major facilitator superfamily (MFS) profile domain-containing protein n=1 Tax=Acanthocheilonema viteae TaxID=6277 RepID=A0A498SWR9_ACAVI|nr:unnamed protein product [Acanthocheilonema viteae]
MNITYWAMALLSTTLSEDGFTGYFLSGFIELPGGLLAVVLLLKFGRRTVTVWSFTMQFVLFFLTVFFPGTGIIQITLAVIAKFFNSFLWVAQPLMIAEMSPTTVRNIFCGTVSFFGVIGAVIAPYLPLLLSFAKLRFHFFTALLILKALKFDSCILEFMIELLNLSGNPEFRDINFRGPKHHTRFAMLLLIHEVLTPSLCSELILSDEKTISPEAPKVTVSIVSLAAAIVLLTAPETKDLPMPEDVNDFDPGRFLQLFGYQKQRKQSVFMAAENAAIFEEWTTVCLSLLAFLVLKVIIQDVYCFFS